MLDQNAFIRRLILERLQDAEDSAERHRKDGKPDLLDKQDQEEILDVLRYFNDLVGNGSDK